MSQAIIIYREVPPDIARPFDPLVYPFESFMRNIAYHFVAGPHDMDKRV